MERPQVVEGQRYSSLDNRINDEFVAIGQTVLPSAPPRTMSQPRQQVVFTVEEDTQQRSPSCQNSKCCVVTCLLMCCLVSSAVSLGLLGYGILTVLNVHHWSAVSVDDSRLDSWKYTDETTLCVTLSGKDLQHSGCTKHLFNDISDDKNYTCCVRDSRQYSFLYQLMNEEQSRRASAVNNDICTHSNAISEVLHNGTLLWKPRKDCEINGKTTKASLFEIKESDMYYLYIFIAIRFEKTYWNLPHHQIRIKLNRRPVNVTNGMNDVELMHQTMNVRKEFQNFENVFFYGAYKLQKGESIYIEVKNSEYLYNYEEASGIGFFKI
ncbi:unnamed protein product [Mytilus coruscus]|uniref:THD domain-containing protein n=1 Tax=Mytilus coruscus TaxID=42192 RepID=A0A6J8DEV2_MYTCO|nr:unnamed protein product [Mytilus coruscus]